METTSGPGRKALLENAGVPPPVTADHLAFRLGPRLNAAGRLGDAKLGVHLLLTPDPAKAANIACLLEEANRTRQNLEREMTSAALSQLSLDELANAHVIIVSGEDWNPGLIGLTAGRLCERFHLPVIALSVHGDTATGSCRSIPGVNIYKILSACGDLLERFGGHAQAAGLTLRTENIEAFREKLDRVVRENSDPSCFDQVKEYDLVLPFRTWTPAALTRLSALEPSGCGNPPPVFLLTDVSVQAMRRVGKDMTHLQMQLLSGDTMLKGIGFSMGSAADTGWQEIDILYKPVLNEFRGKISVEAQVTALRPSK
jgi:single-stranded-DNA-specific exonuclease